MRVFPAALLLVAAALPAWAQSPLIAELRVWATRYHENPQKIDELRAALEQAEQKGAAAHFWYGTKTGRWRQTKRVMRSLFLLPTVKDAMEAALDLDLHYTNMRVSLARTLWKKGRAAEARREALAVVDKKAPSNPADWTVKDVPQAKALLDRIKERS